MKILELCLSLDLGGLELYVQKAFNILAQDNDVFLVLAKNSSLSKRQEPNLYLSGFAKAFKLASFVIKNKIDIIHFHWAKDLRLCVTTKIICGILGRKIAIVYHRHMQIPSNKKSFYHRFVYSKIDLMLVITKNLHEEARRFLPKSFANKIHTLYYPVEASVKKNITRKSVDIGENDYLVGLFGRIEHQKGQHLLIQAITNINKTKDIKALIVGRAMNEAYKTELTKNANNNVRFLDFTQDVYELMSLCDLIVLTTKNETFGLVLAEAMLLGVGVIASNKGGALELVGKDEQRGLLFESMNATSLEEKILFAYNNKDSIAQKITLAKDFAQEKFAQNLHTKKLNELLSIITKNINQKDEA